MAALDSTGINDRTRIERASVMWNTIGSTVYALQSVVVLVTVSYVCGTDAAGVFTFAYANASLFANVGQYGMRPYQVSDRKGRYSFSTYRTAHAITTAVMIMTGNLYVFGLADTYGYDSEKTIVLITVCVYLGVTAFEDVFHGNFQQHGRLDIAARLFSARVSSSIAVFCLSIILSQSLIVGAGSATLYSIGFLVCELAYARKRYSLPVLDGERKRGDVARLLRTCFPLFAAAFLLFYIGNAPRYAIDGLMTDTAQAYYGYIAMPVFVVSLLASFVYYPMITSLTDQWNSGHVRVFMMRFGKVLLAIVGITVACDVAALLAGVPVLDLLYNADTAPYLGDLVVLVTGGGFLAIASLAVVGITIIRFQRVLVAVYVAVSVAAWVLSRYAVAGWGITGAAWTYFICMAALAVLLVGLFVAGVKTQR